VAIFGRNTARQRLRRAAQESLKIPAFSAPVDCTPWVTGGLWPVELSTVTAETAPLVKYLKADLQRIVDSANEELKSIRRAGWAESTRQAEESRVINEARAFAVRRVESTVRHLRNMKQKLPAADYRRVNGADDTEKTTRFKLAPPRPEANEPEEPAPPSPEVPEYEDRPAAAVEQPDSWEPAAETAEHAATPAEPLIAEPDTAAPAVAELESPEPTAPEPTYPFESDDTEVLAEIATELREIAPLAEALVDQSPRHHQPVERAPEAPAAQPPSPPPAAPRPEPEIDDAETTRHQVPAVEPESERQRLERLLKFVARQEPGLRWAIGTRDDGTTLLVTDLAHGWIPPGITLPADVRLLGPGRRTGPATALLGQTSSLATYAPGDPLGWATDYDATETSPQPRELPAVDDLGWILGEATHWRDGLPRMVHTLAKAGAAGTGILDAEIDILRVYLDTSRYQLLAQYPDIDPGLLLNCLLLAATEGMATMNAVNANYHFAWFQMLSAPPASGWKAGP
jgi:Family of unknown function (DUF5631)/Family of unknown function (DUF5632)